MTTMVDPKDLLIRTMPTPNPLALKFVLNVSLKDDGKATFNEPEECEDLPLVRDLFALEGVKQIHLFQNTLTVTYSGEVVDREPAIENLGDKVDAVIRTRYPVHNPQFGESATRPKERAPSSDPKIQAIEAILDRTIRPGLQADGGDVEVVSLINDELRILYQGACGGCPSSAAGTLEAIQSILRSELEDDKLVVMPV